MTVNPIVAAPYAEDRRRALVRICGGTWRVCSRSTGLAISACAAGVIALSACAKDQCADARVETSWCEGDVVWACTSGGGMGRQVNYLFKPKDCSALGLDCVESKATKEAGCGFTKVPCEAGVRYMCVKDWIAECFPHFDHPIAELDCSADNTSCQEDVTLKVVDCFPLAE